MVNDVCAVGDGLSRAMVRADELRQTSPRRVPTAAACGMLAICRIGRKPVGAHRWRTVAEPPAFLLAIPIW
jgi:hypothetical protein